jgi:hypothetical protein
MLVRVLETVCLGVRKWITVLARILETVSVGQSSAGVKIRSSHGLNRQNLQQKHRKLQEICATRKCHIAKRGAQAITQKYLINRFTLNEEARGRKQNHGNQPMLETQRDR